jgi:TRAP-type C4-dicarboxylate transport system substrate-binding protein
MIKTTKIRWVIAHEPLNLFIRAAEDFERKVNAEQSEHKIEVEIMTLTEYSQRYNDGVIVTKHDLLDLMQAGKIEMSQMYTTWLAEHYEQDMLALDMPFLFGSHEHATRVLEGEIGEKLLANLANKSNIRGLSYTYSGGFRQLISNKSVSTLDELVGTTQRSNRNPVARATLSALGIVPHACEIEDLRNEVIAGNCEGGETNYPRMYPLNQNEVIKSVIDTEHSLFLTSMIIGDQFWAGLSSEVQAVIKRAAVEAGREERAETIRDGERAQVRLVQEGATIHKLSAEQRAEAVAKTAVVYDQLAEMFTPGLVDQIRQS